MFQLFAEVAKIIIWMLHHCRIFLTKSCGELCLLIRILSACLFTYSCSCSKCIWKLGMIIGLLCRNLKSCYCFCLHLLQHFVKFALYPLLKSQKISNGNSIMCWDECCSVKSDGKEQNLLLSTITVIHWIFRLWDNAVA